MKRLLTSAVMFLCCIATSFAQFSGSGSGTESDPYLILNPIQLNQMRNYLNQTGVYFKLMADIDLTEFLEDEYPSQGWQPVGTSSTPFKGILDGNGKKVSGLWINRNSSNYVGFFGDLSGGIVKNLTLKGTSINGSSYVGLLSGNSGTVIDCTFSGKVNGVSNVGGCVGCNGNFTRVLSTVDVSGNGNYVGGISGAHANINNCTLISNYVRGHDYVGGICGYYDGEGNTLTNAFSYTDIEGNNYVGGIAGRIANVGKYNSHGSSRSIINSGYAGDITANSYVGGICGEHSSKSSINRCFAVGSIIARSDYVGGLVGYSNGTYNGVNETIDQSYFCGTIAGGNYTGGIVGEKYMGLISKCYAYATISGTKYVGGVFGEASGYSTEHNFKAISNVANIVYLKSTEGVLGRIYGKRGGSAYVGEMGTANENKAYNRTVVINEGVVQDIIDGEQNGTGVSVTTLKLKATYVAMGWDFTDTWAIQETECYPYMKTQTAPPVIQSQVVSGATTVSGKCIDGGTITLEIDGVKQQMVSSGNTFSFTVSPLQAGHEVRVSAKADDKEQSYYTTEVVSFLGKGTEADPYQISTAADLTQVYRKGYYKLMNDIDLTDYINQFSPSEGWQSIGRDGSETIHFDGDGHKITGLWCNSTRDNTGLFSCFANGTIKNLTVETANGKKVKGGSNTGILIGKMINGTVENCHVSGTVGDGTPVGGMVGLFDGGKISKCQANVTISTTLATSYVGGLVGTITGGTIDQCVTTGTLTATGKESYVGGLVGKNSATMTNCYSTAAVTSSYNAAGIVAYNYGVVDMCYATGDLYSNNYAAGVIGYNDGTKAVVRNCAAMNNKIDVVYESQQTQQGGGYGQRIIGGIKNNAPAPEMNNYALKTMQVSLNDVPQLVYDDIMNGTAKTNAELKQKTTYQELDWDFDNVWKIDEDESYPYQTVKVEGGSDPTNPDDPGNPDDPQGEIEITNISQIGNVIYIEPIEETKGSEVVVPILMKNTADIRGFQFDLVLPNGVTMAKTSKGKYVCSLSSGRLPEDDEHTLTLSEQEDGAIRFLCGSQYNETFTGNEGEIATMKLLISEDMKEGKYPIVLKKVKLSETNISNYYYTETVQTSLTVISYIPGDISGDGEVDVSDYIGVANFIMGDTPEGFIEAAADVNKDKVVDVSDYIGVANIILYGNIYGPVANASRGATQMENSNSSASDNHIYVEPFEADANSQTTISFKMKNMEDIRGFQFDLYLPKGISIVKDGKNRIMGILTNERKPEGDRHTLTLSEQEDGAIRFLCASMYDETFTGNDGEIATLTVSIASDMALGDYPILLKKMKLSETNIGNCYETETRMATVTISNSFATGIKQLATDRDSEMYYNLQGQRVSMPTKGVFVKNGKKVMMK